MQTACLQYSSQLGQVSENIARVNNLLDEADTSNLDLLVLPELAFTGYNFPSLAAISPYLEPTAAGPSTTWALATATRFKCIVSVGYPEKSTILVSPDPSSTSTSSPPTTVANYNSTITVSPTGTILAHYRKTHLYYTDEPWAQESPTGWLTTNLPLPPLPAPQGKQDSIGILTAFGICMDLNPHRFLAPYSLYEFATHAHLSQAELIVLSTAWTTSLSTENLMQEKKKPDLDTLVYWIGRLGPLLGKEGEEEEDDWTEKDRNRREKIIVVANRCGEEGDTRYAGTSVVMGVGGRGQQVRVWGVLGRGVEGVLRVDTRDEGMMLRLRRVDGDDDEEE